MPVDRGEHPLSRATERQTKNYVGYQIIKTVFCDSHFTIIAGCRWFALYVIKPNLDFKTT